MERRPLPLGAKLTNIEFHLQIFLTAEIIAEAYYNPLRRFSGDSVIEKSCARILKDKIRHLSFHAVFLIRKWLRSHHGRGGSGEGSSL